MQGVVEVEKRKRTLEPQPEPEPEPAVTLRLQGDSALFGIHARAMCFKSESAE
jgi:hypothetical protein